MKLGTWKLPTTIKHTVFQLRFQTANANSQSVERNIHRIAETFSRRDHRFFVRVVICNNQTPIFVGKFCQTFIHVKDFARACEAFTDSVIRHGLYNLGGGRDNAMTLRELVIKMEQVSNLQAVIDKENPLPAPAPMNYVSDLMLITQELDWSPEITLEKGLKSLF